MDSAQINFEIDYLPDGTVTEQMIRAGLGQLIRHCHMAEGFPLGGEEAAVEDILHAALAIYLGGQGTTADQPDSSRGQ